MNFFFSKKIQLELRFRRGPWMDTWIIRVVCSPCLKSYPVPTCILVQATLGLCGFRKRRLLSHDSQIQLRKVVIKYQEFLGLDELENSKDKNKL